jgi:hypothetical protein
MGKKRNARVLEQKSEGRYHLEITGVDGRIVLKWTFRQS